MKITKATRWRVFAGVWIQSYSLLPLPSLVYSVCHFVINLDGVIQIFQWHTQFICLSTVQ